ncbi:putative methionyl-tRNA synthetase [Hordeum vulgare]|nr:putative methionyl-tRNA synthetase [Hordeum vulgare]
MDAKEEGEEEQAEVEPEPAPKARKKKRASNAKPVEPHVKWTSKEDGSLAEAWKTVSTDLITCAYQNTDTYWGRIKTAFDECKLVDPNFANFHMDHGDKAMVNQWATIHTTCNKWHGIIEEVVARPESGANVKGQMARMIDMYRQDNNDQEFKFLHVFSRIESCEKWREVWLALAKATETYNSDVPTPAAAEGRPDGTKKARAARDAAPAAERHQSSIEQCIADAKNSDAKRKEKFDTRLSALMMKQDVMLDLLTTNIVVKKRNTNLAFLIGAGMSMMDE